MLGIALECGQLMRQFAGKLLQPGLDIRKAGSAIDARFATTEQIEIGTVDQEQARHLAYSCQFAGDGGNSNPNRRR